MKSIILPLTSELDVESLAKATAIFGKHLDAHVTGLFVRRDPKQASMLISDSLTAEMVQTLCDATEVEGLRNAENAHDIFKRIMQQYGYETEPGASSPNKRDARWRVLIGDVSDHVGRAARTYDFSVCMQPDTKKSDPKDVFTDLVFRSARSVLMLPQSGTATEPRNILVAWNGKAECARAVAGALPMLKKAEKVTLLQIGDIGEDLPSVADIHQYLSDHGINAAQKITEGTDAPVGLTVQEHGDSIGADVIVIGAYSQARWRELILGGVTRYLIENSTKPVYMSH